MTFRITRIWWLQNFLVDVYKDESFFGDVEASEGEEGAASCLCVCV